MRTKVCGFDKMEREHAGIDGFNWGGGSILKTLWKILVGTASNGRYQV